MIRPIAVVPAWLSFFCLVSIAAIGVADQPPDEYQVKAAFLYNFAKFVEWPPGSFQSAAEPLSICIPGRDPFGGWLEKVVEGHAIETHPVTVRHIAAPKQAAGCHVVFFGQGGGSVSDLSGHGVLTVEDSDSNEDGAVIYFRLESGRVRFEISLPAAEREKLRISSRLLSLARNVQTGRK